MYSTKCMHYDKILVSSLNGHIDGEKTNYNLKSLSSNDRLNLLLDVAPVDV